MPDHATAHLLTIIDGLDLPEPVHVTPAEGLDGGLGLTVVAGEDALVVIVANGDQLLIGPGRIRWHGPAHPRPEPRAPERFTVGPRPDETTVAAMREAVSRSITRRRRGFRRCRMCRTLGPVEHMNTGGGVCDGCAQAHLGVVF